MAAYQHKKYVFLCVMCREITLYYSTVYNIKLYNIKLYIIKLYIIIYKL